MAVRAEQTPACVGLLLYHEGLVVRLESPAPVKLVPLLHERYFPQALQRDQPKVEMMKKANGSGHQPGDREIQPAGAEQKNGGWRKNF